MTSLSQYAVGDIRKSILVDYNQNSPYKGLPPSIQSYKHRELNKSILHDNDKTTESKYDEIRKKYGNREKSTSELYQSRALQQITLRNSQYMNTAAKIGIKHQNLGQKQDESYANLLNRKSFIDQKEKPKQETTELCLKTPQKIFNIPISNNLNRSSRRDSSYLMRSVERSNIQNTQQDLRVESIDKINMKIHQILNSFNQTSEKKNASLLNQKPLDKQILISSLQKPRCQEQKQSVRNSILQKSNRQSSVIFNQNRRLSMNSSYNAGILKKSATPNDQKFKRRESSIFKDRDIDAQIRRIQQRIKRTEEQKKKLNLSDKQWREASLNRKPSRDFKHAQKASFIFERKNRLISKQINNNTQLENEKYSISVSKVEVTQQKASISPPVQNVLKQSESKLNIPQLKQSSYKQSIDKATQVVKDIKKSIIFNEDLLQHQKVQTKKLIEALKNQVNYDQHWRNAKAILSQRLQLIDYDKIEALLKQNGIILSIQDIKKELQLTLQEHNPFFSVRQADNNQSFEELIRKYIKTNLHWQNEIKGKFDSNRLTKQKFNQTKIDLEKKGSINIEDFVRFLNIETGNFYRNRDLVLVFRRLSCNNTIMYKEFLDVVCSK